MKCILHYFLFSLFCFLPVKGFTQFLNIQLDITPDVETVVEQQLDFGQITTGSGIHRVKLGDSNVGVFRLNALRAQCLLISLNADDELIHTNPAIDFSIRAHLMASYSNGINDAKNSVPLKNLYENIVIEGSPSNPFSIWSSVYIYIFGRLNIHNIPAGTYLGNVTLTVIYI